MYLNGMGFRGIERVIGVHHTTFINWVKQVGELLPNAYDREVIPEVGELDELQTFVGSKKTKYGIGCAVDHFKPCILGWILGDRSSKTFEPLWEIVKKWQCYFYVTRTRMRSSRLEAVCANALRWKVYPGFIQSRRSNCLQNIHDTC